LTQRRGVPQPRAKYSCQTKNADFNLVFRRQSKALQKVADFIRRDVVIASRLFLLSLKVKK